MPQLTEIPLAGLRGDNPLAYLAALGTLAALDTPGDCCRLRWKALTPVLSWLPRSAIQAGAPIGCSGQPCPLGHRSLQPAESDLVLELHRRLHREPLPDAESQQLQEALRELRRCKTAVSQKRNEIRRRRMPRDQGAEARRTELTPLENEYQSAKSHYLALLGTAFVDPVLSLGEDLTVSNEEWKDFVERMVSHAASLRDFRTLSLLASFGIGDPNNPEEQMLSTPWALLRGAGHQHFLGSVRELMLLCTPCHFATALFGPWVPSDERFSLRWDPAEDRRYALMAADPTAPNNRTRTVWGANRLAFEGLQFFPAWPARRMAVAAWRNTEKDNWDTNCQVRWALWENPLSACAVRSLLILPDLWQDPPASSPQESPPRRQRRRAYAHSLTPRQQLLARGVFAVFTSSRIRNDKYYNLTPGALCWAKTRHSPVSHLFESRLPSP